MSAPRPATREVVVVEDAGALAEAAAQRLLRRLSSGRGRYAVCLSGGSAPLRLYARLVDPPYRTALPWERVHWFIGDERFVPLDDPRSNMGTACRALLDRLASPDNVHPVDTAAASPQAAARSYEQTLRTFHGGKTLERAHPLFDMVLLGVGGDGHTASLFPGDASLKENERWVVGVERAGIEPYVPRVTLTFPALAAAREMLFLASGAGKRDILARVFAGDDLPAARAHCDGALAWLIDRAAAPATCVYGDPA